VPQAMDAQTSTRGNLVPASSFTFISTCSSSTKDPISCLFTSSVGYEYLPSHALEGRSRVSMTCSNGRNGQSGPTTLQANKLSGRVGCLGDKNYLFPSRLTPGPFSSHNPVQSGCCSSHWPMVLYESQVLTSFFLERSHLKPRWRTFGPLRHDLRSLPELVPRHCCNVLVSPILAAAHLSDSMSL
jgi:hypothetical protein